MTLNDAQRKHVADTLRALGLGQLAGIGYVAVDSGLWLTACSSILVFVVLDIGAVGLLKEVGNV